MPSDDAIAGMVREFHEAFGLRIAAEPTVDVHTSTRDLRIDLLAEEVEETRQAALAGDLVGIADGLADLVYVAYGTALTYGIDLDRVLAEVHRSNMSKLDADGRPVYRADGKVLKSDRYSLPDVASCLTPGGGTR